MKIIGPKVYLIFASKTNFDGRVV